MKMKVRIVEFETPTSMFEFNIIDVSAIQHYVNFLLCTLASA